MKKRNIILLLIAFTHGIFLTLIIIFYIMSDYENRLYKQILSENINEGMSEKNKVIKLLDVTHNLVEPRTALFSKLNDINLRDKFFRSSEVQLIDGRGGCGSFVHVLGVLLKKINIEFRVAQMKCKNVWACHIIAEAKINEKWVLLDPTYNLYFINKNNELASINDLLDNFNYYKSQLPDNYDLGYDYEDIRYTNWNRLPILNKVIELAIGKENFNNISLRVYMLDVYKNFLFFILFLYLILIIISFQFLKKIKFFTKF